MPRTDTPRELVTGTGIRIVGAAAADLMARAIAVPIEPPAADQVFWAARFRARPRLGNGSPVPAILAVIEDHLRRDWDAVPAVSRDARFTRPASRFHGGSWEAAGQPGTWRGELIWRHPHPVLSGTPCITWATIDEQQGHTQITLCEAADGGVSGVRGTVGAGQGRPALLDALRRAVMLTAHGLGDAPQMLADGDVADFVRNVMLSDSRTWPVAVLAPLETGGYLVPPEQVAAELFGLAPVYAIERHTGTFRLTDAVGDRRLSAYWGALRLYLPEFSCADRPEDHPLLMRDRVEDPVQRAALVGRLGRAGLSRLFPAAGGTNPDAAAETVLRGAAGTPVSIARDEPAPSPARVAAAATTAPAPAAAAAAPAPPLGGELLGAVQALAAQIRDLSGTIAHLVAANLQLGEEVGRLRATTVIRASSANAVDRRLGVIEALLRPAAPEPDDDGPARELEAEDAPTLVDAVRDASSEYADALLVLETAETSAAKSPFEDIERAATTLQAMALVARRRLQGGLDTGLRAAFQELGIDYRGGIASSTSEKLARQYQFAGPDGRLYDCPEHIAIGSTYDPRYCLRIYFTSRAPTDPRFVVGHVGRHFDVKSTT